MPEEERWVCFFRHWLLTINPNNPSDLRDGAHPGRMRAR